MEHNRYCPHQMFFFGGDRSWGVGSVGEIRISNRLCYEFDGRFWRPIPTPDHVGDLSKADAAALVKYASRASSILEFGSGGSSQLIAAVRPPDSKFWSVETEPYWVQTTKDNIAKFGGVGPEFLTWEEWEGFTGEFDMVFVDGLDMHRRAFGMRAWPMLKVGGVMILHDCLRLPDYDNAMAIARHFFEEVESIQVNESDSNMVVIRKKEKRGYKNWQLPGGDD